jgi:SAM-dependent methyltransferase
MKLTGVDLSKGSIQEARALAASGHLSAEFVRADMRDLPWDGAFDAAYCFGNSFGYLGPEGSRAFLAAVSRTLKPGALFALDAGMAAEAILPHLKDKEWMEFGDILFLEENRYDPIESALETRYTFVRGGRSDTRVGVHSVFTVREIRSMLREVGLIPTAVYGSLAGAPYQVAARAVYLVARKDGLVA